MWRYPKLISWIDIKLVMTCLVLLFHCLFTGAAWNGAIMLHQVVYYTKVVKVSQNTKFFKNIHFPMKFIFLWKLFKKCEIFHIIFFFFRKIVVNSLQTGNTFKWWATLFISLPWKLHFWKNYLPWVVPEKALGQPDCLIFQNQISPEWLVHFLWFFQCCFNMIKNTLIVLMMSVVRMAPPQDLEQPKNDSKMRFFGLWQKFSL